MKIRENKAKLAEFYHGKDEATQKSCSDILEQFIFEKCKLNPYLFVIPSGLYGDYQGFCEKNDLDFLEFRDFKNEMFDRYDIYLSSFLAEGKMIEMWEGIGWNTGIEVKDTEAIQEKTGDDLRIPYPNLRKELDRKIPGWQNMPKSKLGYLYHTCIKKNYHDLYEPIGKLLGLYHFRSRGVE